MTYLIFLICLLSFQLCMRCTHANTGSSIRCVSLDCPLLYKLHRSREEAARVCVLRKALEEENMFWKLVRLSITYCLWETFPYISHCLKVTVPVLQNPIRPRHLYHTCLLDIRDENKYYDFSDSFSLSPQTFSLITATCVPIFFKTTITCFSLFKMVP